MKVVLMVNPPSPFLISPIVFPPLGLLYVAAAVERAGHMAEVVDLAAGESLEGYTPDLIGISACTPHVPLLSGIITQAKEFYPEVPIIIGGPHFTQVPLDAMKLGIDTVSVGDGEGAILKALNGGKGVLKGLIDVDEGPMPARYLIDLNRYKYSIGGAPATSMITSRGCPYHCNYCSRGFSYDKLRNHHLDLVAKELEDIKFRGFNAVMFYDDELNISSRRLSSLCSVFKSAEVTWRAFVRSNLFTNNHAQMMKESGCVEICCGVESGSEEILKTCNKRATVANATNARRIAADWGLRFKAFMIIGLPGESEETVEQSRRWLLENRPDDFDLSIFTPYPGSVFYNHPNHYDIKIHGSYWDEPRFFKGKPGKYHSAVSTSHLTADRIGELRDQIEQEVRLVL